MVSVLLADDHPVVREGLRTLIQAEPDFNIVGESSDGAEAVRMVEELKPDVLVMDVVMPRLNGLDALPIIKQRAPETRTIILSMHDDEAFLRDAIRNGARAYVLKGSEPHHLVNAIRTVREGGVYISPPLQHSAMIQPLEATSMDPHETLTPREREVLQLIAEGNTNAKIADRLTISIRTVEMHRGNLMRKLGLRTPADVVRYAIKRRMIPINGPHSTGFA